MRASSNIFQFTNLENLDKSEVKNKNIPIQRTVGGILTNHHQRDINKYIQNRVKPAFSHYEKNNRIPYTAEFNNFPIPIIPEKKYNNRPTTCTQNEYGLGK